MEEVSYLLKHQGPGGLKIEDFLQLEEIHNYSKVAENLQGYIDKMQSSTKKVGVQDLIDRMIVESCRW